MRVRRYKTDPAVLFEQGREIMKSSDGSLFYLRVMSVNMVLSGRFSHEVGAAAGVSRATIDNWVRAVDKIRAALKRCGRRNTPGGNRD